MNAPVARSAADALAYPEQGLRLARPQGWTAELRSGVIRLRSADGRLGVGIVTAPRRTSATQVERDVIRSLRRPERRVRTVARSRAPLGDLPASSRALALTDGDGRRSEVVVLSARSRWRTYAVTVYNAGGQPVSTSSDVAAILDSFEFARPGSARPRR